MDGRNGCVDGAEAPVCFPASPGRFPLPVADGMLAYGECAWAVDWAALEMAALGPVRLAVPALACTLLIDPAGPRAYPASANVFRSEANARAALSQLIEREVLRHAEGLESARKALGSLRAGIGGGP